MNREFIHKLTQIYSKEGLDLLKALRVWKESQLSPDGIRDQVRNDVERNITAVESRELYHLGSAMKYDYDSIVKEYEVSKGREDLLPENIKNDSVRLSPAIRMSMDRVGANLFRHKTAKTYWTMKEKVGDNGEKAVYLVAVEEQDNITKMANPEDEGI